MLPANWCPVGASVLRLASRNLSHTPDVTNPRFSKNTRLGSANPDGLPFPSSDQEHHAEGLPHPSHHGGHERASAASQWARRAIKTREGLWQFSLDDCLSPRRSLVQISSDYPSQFTIPTITACHWKDRSGGVVPVSFRRRHYRLGTVECPVLARGTGRRTIHDCRGISAPVLVFPRLSSVSGPYASRQTPGGLKNHTRL